MTQTVILEGSQPLETTYFLGMCPFSYNWARESQEITKWINGILHILSHLVKAALPPLHDQGKLSLP